MCVRVDVTLNTRERRERREKRGGMLTTLELQPLNEY
jgi:hypothetical protein